MEAKPFLETTLARWPRDVDVDLVDLMRSLCHGINDVMHWLLT